MNELVSIIMPCYNGIKYITESINSVINQTYTNWELLIIDDCSSDNGMKELFQSIIEKDNRIKLFSTSVNSGAGVARNIGIKESKGRFLAFCDSDDWWYPFKLEEQLKFMEDNRYEFTCSYYEDSNEKLEPYYTMKQAVKQNFHSMIAGCNIGTPGVVIDTQRIGKKYMPNLRRAEDWGLWMLILKEIDYLYTYPKPLWKYRHIPNSGSSNKLKQINAVLRMYNSVLGYNILKSWIIALFIFLPNNIFKKLKKV